MAKWRTEEKLRLEEICEGQEFVKLIAGHPYCGLGLTKKIGCKYQSTHEDLNNLYECCHPCYLENIEYNKEKD